MQMKYIIVNEKQPWEELISVCSEYTANPTTKEFVKFIAEQSFYDGDFVVTVCV